MMRRPSPDLDDPSRNLQESRSGPSDGDDMEITDITEELSLSMPPTEEDVRQQDSRIFTPPPRIAARFYRPSQARRKDSAASSRRNSISSAHSRCSSVQPGPDRSHSNADQSKYIAQHLRRANFLEDRRARLADRAAHAEKVRLRAAMAKAATRDTTLSEERALAAQQARDRNLAEIVANCSEEVRKAKQVAEMMKEKREQDLAKMKLQMEERMAEAEKRREELRKQGISKGRGRGQSLMTRKPVESIPPITEQEVESERESEQGSDHGRGHNQVSQKKKKDMTPKEAASKIAGCWMGYRRRKAILDFNDLGLSVDGIRDSSFDTVVELLAQEKVLLGTARLLRLCGLREADPGSVGEMAAVRTFLSAFLILGHPNQVLASKDTKGGQDDDLAAHRLPPADLDNPQLQGLVGKAKDLLVCFENILARLTAFNRYTMPPALKKSLPEVYAVFYNAFIAWKSRDSNALIEVMLMQFVELDAIFHTVKDTTDDAASQLYKQSIQDSQLMLIVRIKKLAGQEKGKKMIFEAVQEARKARKAKKKTGDTKPRIAEAPPSEEASSTAAGSLVSPESQNLTPPSTPAASRGSKPAVVKTGLNGLLPDNRVVVHELAINKEYQIPSDEYQEQQSALTRPLYESMKIRTDSDDKDSTFIWFIALAVEIREKLQRLLRPGNSMHNLIGEVLDPEVAKHQYKVGNFSYEKFFASMSSLLPKLCAPFRDDEVKDLITNKLSDGNVIDRAEALNRFIDVMLCDYINYLLRIAAPGLIESSAQYEAKRFAQEVESGQITLQAAEASWRAARSKVLAEAAKRDPEGILHPKSKPASARFYSQLLVDVFTQPMPVDVNTVPEMLRLDLKRIEEVSTMVQRIITVGAVLLQCKNLLKRDVRSPWKIEAARIMTVLDATHPSMATTLDGTIAAIEAGRSMPSVTRSHLRALVSKVLLAAQDMGQNGNEPREPVIRLLLARLRGTILSRLAAGSVTERVKAANTAGEKLAGLGLSEFVGQVRGIVETLDKVGEIDRASHGPWWDAIATKIEQEE